MMEECCDHKVDGLLQRTIRGTQTGAVTRYFEGIGKIIQKTDAGSDHHMAAELRENEAVPRPVVCR
jgi:hypothetical protein